MIALDTDVLVRYLVGDHAEQSKAARRLADTLTSDKPAYVCREVLVELVRVLERCYGFSREEISRTLLELHVTDEIVLETADDVALCAVLYRRGIADFRDLIVVAASRRGEAPLYTFDRSTASRLDGVELVPVAKTNNR